MNRTISRLFYALLAASGLFFAVGCHTIEGAGRDVQAVGEGVEETARDVRR
jgi:predicted small secreted protein